jgi:protein-tyrosine phosphatase
MVLKIDTTQEFIHRLIKTLEQGNIVALPTDTIYGLAVDATQPEAVRQLAELKRRGGKPFTFFIAKKNISSYARLTKKRILTYFVPGPITIILKKRTAVRLPFTNDKIGIRIPRVEFILRLLNTYSKPLAVTSANLSGQEPLSSALDIVEHFPKVALTVDGGFLYSKPSTVVDLTTTPPLLTRKGAIPILEIEKVYGSSIRMDASLKFNVLFVCTGNSCRSPMAAGIFKTMVSDDYCDVRSAGTLPMNGLPAAQHAIDVVDEYGGSIADHMTHTISHDLIDWADLILVMEFKHYDAVLEMAPRAAVKTFFLKEYKRRTKYNEIPDPVGKDIHAYRQAAQLMYPSLQFIAQNIKKRFAT